MARKKSSRLVERLWTARATKEIFPSDTLLIDCALHIEHLEKQIIVLEAKLAESRSHYEFKT